MATAVALFTALPVSMVHADEILLEDNSIMLEEDILDGEIHDGEIIDDLIIEDEIGSDDGGNYEDLIIDVIPDDGDDQGGSEEIIGTNPGDPIDIGEIPGNGNPIDKKPGDGSPDDGAKPEPAEGSPAPSGVTSEMQAVLNLINRARANAGARRLTFSSELNRAAAARVKETTVKFSHSRPNGKPGVSILRDFNIDYNKAGENIACCVYTPESVVAAWSASPTHNRCMVNNDYSKAGIGTTTVNGYTYWVLLMTD